MNASSSEDEVFVGASTSVEKKVRAARSRRQTETFTPNFRQRLRGAAGRATVSETEPESPTPVVRLDFDNIKSSPAESPPVVRPLLAKVSKTLFSVPWLSDENTAPTSSRGKSELKRYADELDKKVTIQLHKPGRALRKRANPSSNTLSETLKQARQILQLQEDELSGDNANGSFENAGDCLDLLTSVNTAENSAFSVVVPTITPQSTPVSARVRFGSSDDAPSSGFTKRMSPRIANNLHKSILKANHAAHVAQMNAVSSSTAKSKRPGSMSSTDSTPPSMSRAADPLSARTTRINAAFRFTTVRALSSSSSDSASSSTSQATPARFPNLLSRIMARRY